MNDNPATTSSPSSSSTPSSTASHAHSLAAISPFPEPSARKEIEDLRLH
eukprot:gene8836-15321_t